jgi:hypothetical protein
VLPGGEKRLLDRVFGVLGRAKNAVAVQLELTPVFLDQLREGIRITSLCPGDEISFDVWPPIGVMTAAARVRLLI